MSCEGSGRVVVTLKYYKNPSHRTYEFKCCDAGLFGCSGGCEAYFKICVTKSASANTHSCNMGTTQTAVIGNRDDHRLNLRKEFAFTSLQVSHKILRFCLPGALAKFVLLHVQKYRQNLSIVGALKSRKKIVDDRVSTTLM